LISPNIITEPTTEAVSLTELKEQARIDSSDENTVLAIYQTAARVYYERRTGRTLHETELELVLDRFLAVSVELPRATPLISITSIKYFDEDGTEATFGAANYIADTWKLPGAVALATNASWPSFTPYPVAPVRIRYKAGIETASPVTEVDAADKLPILLLAAALYENREAVNVQDASSIAQISVKYGVEAFIALRKVAHLFPNA